MEATAVETTSAPIETGAAVVRTAKRRRSDENHVVKRRRKVVLKDLPGMPLDVLYEIFQCLEPSDLLSISRTNKTFRRFLLGTSQRLLWRRSLGNVLDLPPCPPFMSEPAYAALAFNKYCNYCLKRGTFSTTGTCLVRCCNACLKNPDNFVELKPYESEEIDVAMDLLPSLATRRRAYFPQDVWIQHQASRDSHESYKLEEIRDKAYWDYQRARLKTMKPIKEAATLLEAWIATRKNDRRVEVKALKRTRVHQIKERLASEEPCLAQEVDRVFWCCGYPSVFQWMYYVPTPLTDRSWRNMKDDVVTLLRTARTLRLRDERAEPYKYLVEELITYLDILSSGRSQTQPQIFAPVANLCSHPAVQKLIIKPSIVNDLPFPDNWMDPILDAEHDWLEETTAALFSLPSIAPEGLPDWEDLACVWFKCRKCSMDAIGFPQVFYHRCLRYTNSEPIREPKTEEDDLANALHDVGVTRNRPTTPDDVRSLFELNYTAYGRAAVIAQYYARDRLTSYADLDEEDPRIACLACEIAMTWRDAVGHKCSKPADLGTLSQFMFLGPEATEQVRVLNREAREEQVQAVSKDAPVYCVRCRPFDESLRRYALGKRRFFGMKKFTTHMRKEHDIRKRPWVEHEDYLLEVNELTLALARPQYPPIDFSRYRARHGCTPTEDTTKSSGTDPTRILPKRMLKSRSPSKLLGGPAVPGYRFTLQELPKGILDRDSADSGPVMVMAIERFQNLVVPSASGWLEARRYVHDLRQD